MSRARVFVEYKGKRYSPSKTMNCIRGKCALASKSCDMVGSLPCEALYDALEKANDAAVHYGWREVK